MKTDNLTNEIIGKYIPNVLTEVEGETPLAEKLAPFIESAKLWLETEYLGPDDFLSDSHNEFAQKIIVKKAFADAVPSLDLIITPSGMAVVNTDNMAPASKERVERLVASLRDYVRVNVSLLLDICHSYEAWRMSERGQYFCGSFINSPKDCDDADLDIPFEEARRRAILFESALAERYIGRETMNAIRSDYNSRIISQSHPLVALIRSILVYVIAPDKFFIDQNHVWHAARPVLNELNYHPKYKKLWESEMGDNFKTAGFVNNVKGGFFLLMDALNLTVPASWSELSQEQLAFLLQTIASVNRANINKPFRSIEDFSAQTSAQVAVYCLFRWNGITVVSPYAYDWLIAHGGHELRVREADIAAATAVLEWINELPDEPVRLDSIDGAVAVAAELDDSFSFDDWLSCEALWQGYQVVKSEQFLQQMAEVLYRKPGIKLREHETLSIFYWWAGLKNHCNRLYPNFFQPAAPGTAVEPDRDMLRRNMDAQIRALTKGDITKEEHILSLPAHRALTELDALAREYEELNRKYPSK